MSLEYAAMFWLWIDQKCKIVLEERSPLYCMGSPDVMGVTQGRYLTEIEIKRSAADFKADFLKRHRIRQKEHPRLAPRQFYYLMPPELAEKLKEKIPDQAGLMTLDGRGYVTVLKRAPVNRESPKLKIADCIRLARQMTAHMMGYALVNRTLGDRLSDFCFQDWVDAEKGTYEI